MKLRLIHLLFLACLLTGPVGAAKLPPKPNILLILADDLGFSDIGCYGGEIATPNLDKLAAGGLRLTQMYNTARCWPTRGCLMTGYYAQQVNRDPARQRPAWAALLPQLLQPAGYRSYHSGKWHVDGKVLAGGFEHSYSFDDHDRYFTPKRHLLDDAPLPTPKLGDGFYSTKAIAQYAVDFLKGHSAQHRDDPFFLYLAFISPHFPLHALPEDIARYKDKYQVGWDVIREQRTARMRKSGLLDAGLSALDPKFTPRYWKEDWRGKLGPGEIEHAVPWQSLSAEQQKFQANKMAVHAAMVDRMDQEIGRVLEQVKSMGAWDNTLIIFLSDNGADASILVRGDGNDQSAAPGSAESFLCLGPGWASAANAPFRRHKIWVHEGGISTPCIIHWPAVVRNGGKFRRSPAHIVDFVPTALELAGVNPPTEWHGQARPTMPGLSLTPLFARDTMLKHEAIYWHHEGNRALRVGDWKIVSEAENNAQWELYNLKRDRIESHNLATTNGKRVAEMSAQWEQMNQTFVKQGSGGN